MVGLARLTAIIFVVLGVAFIIGGAILIASGLAGSPVVAPSTPNLIPDAARVFSLAGTIAGAFLAFQGLLLAAIGQLLWLMAGMAYNAQLSTEYMDELVRRMGNVR